MAIISRTLTYAFNTIFEEAMLVVSICGIYSPICQRVSLLTRVNAKRVAVFTASPSLASFQLPFGLGFRPSFQSGHHAFISGFERCPLKYALGIALLVNRVEAGSS